MTRRNTGVNSALAALLLFSYCLRAESVEINVTGTPSFNLEKPIQIAPDAAPTEWEYQFYPSQTGPEVAVQCENEAYRFLQAVRDAGKKRWELVNFIDVGPGGRSDPCLIGVFKRPKD